MLKKFCKICNDETLHREHYPTPAHLGKLDRDLECVAMGEVESVELTSCLKCERRSEGAF